MLSYGTFTVMELFSDPIFNSVSALLQWFFVVAFKKHLLAIFTHFKVRVDLKEETNLCSAAHKRGKYRQEVTVGRETTRAVTFTIIPMKEGLFPIEIKAAVRGGGSDGVRKMLRVVVRKIFCST